MPAPLTITWKITRNALDEIVKHESSGVVVRRLHAMRLLLAQTNVPEVAGQLGIPERTLRRWVHRFNAKGAAGLVDKPAAGQPPKLPSERVDDFKQRVRDGAGAKDGVCALRGLDIHRILAEEYAADYSLGGVYFLLHRLGFSSLVPRPQHPKADAAVQEEFKKTSCHKR